MWKGIWICKESLIYWFPFQIKKTLRKKTVVVKDKDEEGKKVGKMIHCV
jgi:hypothetical protein